MLLNCILIKMQSVPVQRICADIFTDKPFTLLGNFLNARLSTMLAVCIVTLAACASHPQLAVPYTANNMTAPGNKVGVIMSALPAVDTQFPGAGCLLCYAAASMANSDLTTYTKTLPYEDLSALKEQVATVLNKKGGSATVIAEPLNIAALADFQTEGPNIAKKDFSALKNKYHVDKILVIDLNSIGFSRSYASYIPTSDPSASIAGTAYMVNLSNNTYEWYLPVHVSKASDSKWDEPPKFPGLTNAYFQALEITKDTIVNPLNGPVVAAPALSTAASASAVAR